MQKLDSKEGFGLPRLIFNGAIRLLFIHPVFISGFPHCFQVLAFTFI
jgi:hypothetical protein